MICEHPFMLLLGLKCVVFTHQKKVKLMQLCQFSMNHANMTVGNRDFSFHTFFSYCSHFHSFVTVYRVTRFQVPPQLIKTFLFVSPSMSSRNTMFIFLTLGQTATFTTFYARYIFLACFFMTPIKKAICASPVTHT